MKLSARMAALLVGAVSALLMMIVPAAAQAAPNGALAEPTPGVLYQLLNQGRGQCLAGQSSERVNISGCNVTFTDQFFFLEPAGEAGFYRVRGLATSKCLAILKNGNVRVSRCDPTFDDQWWRLDPAPGANTFMLYNHLRGKCLAAPSANGAATSFDCTPTFSDQSWAFLTR